MWVYFDSNSLGGFPFPIKATDVTVYLGGDNTDLFLNELQVRFHLEKRPKLEFLFPRSNGMFERTVKKMKEIH